MKLAAFTIISLALCACSPGSAQTSAPFVHSGTGFSFPRMVGEFRRSNVDTYNAEGTDVGVGYDLLTPGSQMATTVFVYPAPHAAEADKPAACDKQWNDVKAQIAAKHPGATLVREGSVSAPTQTGRPVGRQAVYHLAGNFAMRDQALQSEADLYCYVNGDWFVAYRTTSPSSVAYRPRLDGFMHALAWPSK